nr:MAG TPA: Protein of unknown function (DUF3645) [Caudoviricetes sp.]
MVSNSVCSLAVPYRSKMFFSVRKEKATDYSKDYCYLQ